MKWVDGGKPVFRVTSRLASTVLTGDLSLQLFFKNCQRLKENGALADAGSPDKIKVLFIYLFPISFPNCSLFLLSTAATSTLCCKRYFSRANCFCYAQVSREGRGSNAGVTAEPSSGTDAASENNERPESLCQELTKVNFWD